MATSIVVSANSDRNITVAPTRLFFPGGLGVQQVTWMPAGRTGITGIEFPPDAPLVSGPTGPGANGEWIASWQTASSSSEGGVWKYTLDLTVDGVPLTRLDPEIQNGIPGGMTSTGGGGGTGGGV